MYWSVAQVFGPQVKISDDPMQHEPFPGSLWTWPHSGAGARIEAGLGEDAASCQQYSPATGASDTLTSVQI